MKFFLSHSADVELGQQNITAQPIKAGARRLQGHITTLPIQAGDFDSASVEFGDYHAVERVFSIKRGLLYQLTALGLVKSVSLRRPGQKFSKRLWHMESVRTYLNCLLDQQNQPNGKSEKV